MSFCRHYPSGGMADNTHCTQGIEMQSTRDTSEVPHRFPCFTAGAEHLCAKYEAYTAEEIARDNAALTAAVTRFAELHAGLSDVCHHCGQTITHMHKTGRCVYGSCGCRLWQGDVPDAWKDRS